MTHANDRQNPRLSSQDHQSPSTLQDQLSQISNFIQGVANDLLRDLFVRHQYHNVILPMTVIRRLDAVLEPTKQKVMEEKKWADGAGIKHQAPILEAAASQAFYNTSPFGLKDLTSRTSQQQLHNDFTTYLDGFSPNVQDILEKFGFRNQIKRLSNADVLSDLVSRFLSPQINFSPEPVLNPDGSVRLPGLDNHAMGTIFKDIVRRFNEDNNEEAGEHWTPRDAVELMALLIFQPVRDRIQSSTYLLYDAAIGTGGMLTIAEQTLQKIAKENGKQVSIHLYGQEVNNETHAVCKADMLLRGTKNVDENIIGGPQHSTLSNDAFPSHTFDFMLSNPPYGKNWSNDLEKMGGRKNFKDPRFLITHRGDPGYSMVTRANDSQMLFLANMLSKMKDDTPLGSRMAQVHSASSLFAGDAGQGESNIRRWTIENDWLEAIVALPINIFYNTGIATYIWVLTNRKPEPRKGYVQLIDATQWHTPLRRNLGQKNCELSPENIQQIVDAFMDFQESEQSRILPNEAFGYWKVTVERPLRIKGAERKVHTVKEIRELRNEGQRDEAGTSVIRKAHSSGTRANPLHGLFQDIVNGKQTAVEYEPDADLRDTEQVPLLHPGGIEVFLRDEVLPYAPDSWYNPEAVRLGYEINFNRHFYKPQPMRSLEEIRADILALERETEGLLAGILA